VISRQENEANVGMCVCSPYVTDSSIAITVCVILFMLPSQAPNYLFFQSCNKGKLPVRPSTCQVHCLTTGFVIGTLSTANVIALDVKIFEIVCDFAANAVKCDYVL